MPLPVLHAYGSRRIAVRNDTTHPHTFFLGRGDLVSDALAGILLFGRDYQPEEQPATKQVGLCLYVEVMESIPSITLVGYN